jgi:hypothetical protein
MAAMSCACLLTSCVTQYTSLSMASGEIEAEPNLSHECPSTGL